MSVRNDIRSAVASAISIAVAGGVYPSDLEEFVVVSIASDVRDTDSQVVRQDARELAIEVECVRKINSTVGDIETELDTMASTVLSEVLSDAGVLAACDYIQYDALDQDLNDETDKSAGVVRLTFTAYYKTSLSDPNTRI